MFNVVVSIHVEVLRKIGIRVGKPVDAELLRKIESIVNDQIDQALDVFAKEATLAEAKRINGLRAVFGEVSVAVLIALS